MRVGDKRSGGRGNCGQDIPCERRIFFKKKTSQKKKSFLKMREQNEKAAASGGKGGAGLTLFCLLVNFGHHTGFQQP